MKFVVFASIVLIGIAVFLATRSPEKHHSDEQQKPDSEASTAKLEKWKATIDDNLLPATRVILTGQPTNAPTESKIGGEPFWPSGKSYPTSGKGDPLHFLVQINFAQIPEPPTGYPTSGLLQVFIAADDLYGSDFTKPGTDDKKNQDYKIVFHAEVEDHVGAPKVAVSEDDYLPFTGESALRFESMSSRVSPLDYRFDALLPAVSNLYDESEPLYEYAIDPPSHQIGGYAVFTQTDPRSYEGKDEDWQVLLQLDSQTIGGIDMMWGDVGIANFFIRPEDLAARDFSQVWYNWDCH
ncbi:MAG: YwqG family protein [Pseudomonadota bacterium]